MTPAENPKPLRTSSALTRASEVPVSTAWMTYSGYATYTNANSSGSVTPVTNETSAAEPMMPATTLRLLDLAVCTMASAAAGSANIMIGKKPAWKMPAVGSPARNRKMSPWATEPSAAVYSPNWNHGTELSRWCRPIGTRSRLSVPNTKPPSTAEPVTQSLTAVRPVSNAG